MAYRKGKEDDYLFCTPYGEQHARDGVRTAIHRYNTNRGVTKTSMYLYRNTFAKKWILNKGDIFRKENLSSGSQTSNKSLFLFKQPGE